MSSTALVWLRRDLRVEDNPALQKAIDHHQHVILVYIFSPEEEAPWAPGAASRWWLHHSLNSLDQRIRTLGGSLVVRRGDSLDELTALCLQTGASAVYWNRLYDPLIVQRDKRIKVALSDKGVLCRSFNGALLREPRDVLKDDGGFYRVYTPFSNRYFRLPALESSQTDDRPRINFRKADVTNQPIPSLSVTELGLLPEIKWYSGLASSWNPGEDGARQRLAGFVDGVVYNYAVDRDIPSTSGISRLSPHFHFGEISPRMVWHTIERCGVQNQREESVRPYLKQLIWRDFAHHLLFHLPHTDQKPFRQQFEYFEWQQDDSLFAAWCKGKTGIPLIDAGMRELWHTGFMHNRVRMLVASFLTKNGLIHWLEGAKWFWDTLVDASLANNTMGWQWTAGCGVDAAPYFRIFAPIRQGDRFDHDGRYVRQWVPEIAGLPDKFIHQPWAAPQNILVQSAVVLGKTYPKPVLDLSLTRKRALDRYADLKANFAAV